MRKLLLIFSLLLLKSFASAKDGYSADSFIQARINMAALSQAVDGAFSNESKFFVATPVDVTPLFFSATINTHIYKVSEYALCTVRALRADETTDSSVVEQWMVLMARNKYEAMELWSVCTALEEGSGRYNIAGFKMSGDKKVDADRVYDFLAEWGALGKDANKGLWENHSVLSCSVDAQNWGKFINRPFEPGHSKAK